VETLFIWSELRGIHRSQEFEVYLHIEGFKFKIEKMVGILERSDAPSIIILARLMLWQMY
jgi:hypothetical protein